MAFIVAVLLRRRKLRNEVAALPSNNNSVMIHDDDKQPGIVAVPALPEMIAPQNTLSALTNLSTLSRGEGVAGANETKAVLITPEAGSAANIVHEQRDELQVP